MGENLKTLRLLHNLLILTVTAVLAFALTPDESDKYKGTLAVACLIALKYALVISIPRRRSLN